MEHQFAKLIVELDSEAESLFRGGKINHLSDLGCSIGAVVASFLAAILVALGDAPAWVVAGIAALPGFLKLGRQAVQANTMGKPQRSAVPATDVQ